MLYTQYIQTDSDKVNDSSLSEPEMSNVLSRSSDQIIKVSCYCIVKVCSSDGKLGSSKENACRIGAKGT